MLNYFAYSLGFEEVIGDLVTIDYENDFKNHVTTFHSGRLQRISK